MKRSNILQLTIDSETNPTVMILCAENTHRNLALSAGIISHRNHCNTMETILVHTQPVPLPTNRPG